MELDKEMKEFILSTMKYTILNNSLELQYTFKQWAIAKIKESNRITKCQ